MKSHTTFIILFLLFEGSLFAKPYGDYDLKKILTITKTENGEKYGLDLQYIDKVITDLAQHAQNYPPKFDNEEDKQRATNDARMLSGLLDKIINKDDAPLELLKRSSSLNSIGHNLDINGAAQKADRDFQKLLSLKPENSEINFAYGVFLGGSNQGEKALPYLKKSAKLGNSNAYYALGMAYLVRQESDLALKNFEIYKKLTPTDKNVVRIIGAIKSGSIKFKTK